MRVVKSGRILGLSLESSHRRLGDVRPFCSQLLETQKQPNRSQHSYLILTIRLQAGAKVAIFPKHRTPKLAKKANPASRLSTPRMTPTPTPGRSCNFCMMPQTDETGLYLILMANSTVV